ncbi:hypothetical protein Cadr_000028412 [Camelus dromedarius]|uniref:Uncharacterized protein n=1 Tax=Camelus dromedarius TaxID=9838 RepID=A0A5N4CHN2_CAMDR|nr:hypothetical protein Cadr_000028412 [Camelus dromedarius]
MLLLQSKQTGLLYPQGIHAGPRVRATYVLFTVISPKAGRTCWLSNPCILGFSSGLAKPLLSLNPQEDNKFQKKVAQVCRHTAK